MTDNDDTPDFTSPRIPLTPQEPPRVDDGAAFDKADWFWRDMDPDDSGDSPHEAIRLLPDFTVSCVCSSFTGPTRYVFRAPVLDADSDDREIFHFATEEEALAAAAKAWGSRTKEHRA